MTMMMMIIIIVINNIKNCGSKPQKFTVNLDLYGLELILQRQTWEISRLVQARFNDWMKNIYQLFRLISRWNKEKY